MRLAVPGSSPAQRDECAAAHDEVIEQRHTDEFPGGEQSLRDSTILRRGLGVSAWVVVSHDDSAGAAAQRRTEHLSRVDQGGRGRAD